MRAPAAQNTTARFDKEILVRTYNRSVFDTTFPNRYY